MKNVFKRGLNLLTLFSSNNENVTTDFIKDNILDYRELGDSAFKRSFERDKSLLKEMGYLIEFENDKWKLSDGYSISGTRIIEEIKKRSPIWKKEHLIKLFKNYRPDKLFGAFEIEASKTCRTLGIHGCYHYANERKIGLHYDSSIFPHIMSAIKGGCAGKRPSWNMSQYREELTVLLKKYNIDPNIRGIC